MRIKLKICGVANLDDALEIDRIGVDFIGVVTDPVSPRYVSEEFVAKLKNMVSTPIVSVKVHGAIETLVNSYADYIQIHRILKDNEIETLSTYNTKKFILYVPASLDYLDYLKKVQRYFSLILFDSPTKGMPSNPKVLRILLDYHRDAGVAGGITLENVHEFLELEPGWIDVSSGVEIHPKKKDLEKIRKLKEVVYTWRK
ncbi:MAG: phosphoribosylanthranilate isomerase [Ignisphaera sp.]